MVLGKNDENICEGARNEKKRNEIKRHDVLTPTLVPYKEFQSELK